MKVNFFSKKILVTVAVSNLFLFSALTARAEGDAVDASSCASVAIGTWKSSAGSTLTITSVDKNIIKGTFLKDPPAVNITGSISTATNGNCPLAFSANWPATADYYPTVTSYTGEINVSKKSMRTIFLYVDPKAKESYQAVSVGLDEFSK